MVAVEDPNFCHEWLGFDVDAIARQIGVWRAGGRPNGASTVAMQISRNLFLWPERSLLRKALEAWITPSVALVLPRRRQLEIYLNIVEFGPGAFGVEAGSQHWFGVGAKALTSQQAAFLVTVLSAPLKLTPLSPDIRMQIEAALFLKHYDLLIEAVMLNRAGKSAGTVSRFESDRRIMTQYNCAYGAG